MKKWRGEGIRTVVYLDDGIAGSKGFNNTLNILQIMKNDLISAGLTLNIEKTNLWPTQIGTWLGFIIETTKMLKKLQKSLEILFP